MPLGSKEFFLFLNALPLDTYYGYNAYFFIPDIVSHCLLEGETILK